VTTDGNIAIVRRFLDEVLNGGRRELIPELWASDLVWHGGSLGTVNGIDAYTQMLDASAESFRGMHLIVDDILAAGDRVVVRFTNGGVSSGPFLGAPPSGRDVRWNGIGIYAIVDGLIAEAWFCEDLLDLAAQLGLVDLVGA
jgi:predicted ester cyclase